MIRSFADEETRQLYLTGRSRKFGNIARAALRKIQAIDFAAALVDLKNPPGNHLEKLHGDREGQYSVGLITSFAFAFGGKARMLPMSSWWTITRRQDVYIS